MEERYWNQFYETGAVQDYLHYVGAKEHRQEQHDAVITSHNDCFGNGIDNERGSTAFRNGFIGDAGRRI